jgi:RES domain-containing protein
LAIDADSVRITGRWVRQAARGTPVPPAREPPPDNRWQRGDVIDALYLADEEQTAWAEWYRHLAEAGLPPMQQMPRELWSWQVDVEVADLSSVERLDRVGLQTPRPGRRTWPPYQAVGAELASEGAAGLIAPSAARPAGLVLCVFRREPDRSPAGAKPIGTPRLIRRPPPPPTGMAT